MLRSAFDHPKFRSLIRELQTSRHVAVGILECLWHFTARFCPQGDIGRFTDSQIADWLEHPEPAKLVSALVRSGWLDTCAERRLIVHDWHQHADDSVKKKLKRCSLEFYKPVATCPDMERHVPAKGPDMSGHVSTARGQGPEARGQRPENIANAGEAPVAETPKPARTIPKPIVTVAKAFGLVGYCGKLLKAGYEPQRLLAWLLLMARRKPDEPAKWLTACIRGGKQPAEAYMSEALALLSARDAEIAAEHGEPAPSFAAVLPVAEVRGESFAARRNRALNALRDAEGGK